MTHAKHDHLLLVTGDPFVKEKIRVFCITSEKKPYHITVTNNLMTITPCDAILIAPDKIDLLLNKENYHGLESPVIYLREQEENSDRIELIKTCVDEIIDVQKITVTGFLRALTNAKEKFYIKNELSKQKRILKKLINSVDNNQSTQSENVTAAEEETTTPQNLLNENNQLIQAIQKQNKELKQLARIDILTKIGNRLSFEETLDKMIAHAKRHQRLFALLMIDFDKFKQINDTLGHPVGDTVLQIATQRLKNILRKSDFIARLGGDEFAIILNEIKNISAPKRICMRIIQDMHQPFSLDKIKVDIEVSIGIACYPSDGETNYDLIKNADAAMYRAKKSTTLKYIYARNHEQS